MIVLMTLIACIPPGSQGPEGTDYVPDTGWEDEETVTEFTGCVPDVDPALSAAELLYDDQVISHYRGKTLAADADGWDFSGGTVAVELRLRDLSEFWFADFFTGATHVSALDMNGDDWGIYRADDTGLWLLGVASDLPNYTALNYSPAVTLWETPLAAGQAWLTDAAATGLYEGDVFPMDLVFGNQVHLVHHYDVLADGAGDVVVDAGTYSAQRVSIQLDAIGTDNFGWQWGRETANTWLFVAPCTGLVARITDTETIGLGL